MPKVRDTVIGLLRELGMTTVFGNPGSTELPMFKEFPEDFRYVLGLQESVVVGMADGFAQASRNAALVNLHSSAGTGHALGNLFTAFKNQTPLVVTAGQQARSILPFEPFLHAERATEFPRPFIKWAAEPARPADVPRAIARAYYEAMTPPCGPAFVSVPVDDWDEEAEPVSARRIWSLNPGDPRAVTELAAALRASATPAFVLGAGAARDGAWESLIRLAEQHNAAVYVAPFANRNVFPESHPLFRGFLPPRREAIVSELSPHDLIVTFGGPLNLYHVEGSGPHVPASSKTWLVSDNPGQLAWAPEGCGILANTRCVAEQLLEASEPTGRARPPLRRAAASIDANILDDRLLMSRIAALLQPDAIVVEEAPSSRPAMQDYLQVTRPDAFFTTASGGLGYGLPAAVGVALARPGAQVVAILGDGSAMYSIQGLFSAFQLRAPICFVIINNTRYEALCNFGQLFGIEQVLGTDLAGLDFCALAKGHGIPAIKITSADELDERLNEAFKTSGPMLVEVMMA